MQEDCKANKTEHPAFSCPIKALKSRILNLPAPIKSLQDFPKKPLLIGKDLFDTTPSACELTEKDIDPRKTLNSLQVWKKTQEPEQKFAYPSNAKLLNMLQSSNEFLLSRDNI